MSRSKSAGQDNPWLGASLIVGAVFLMTCADALVKLVSADFTLWQIFTARGLIAVPLLAAYLRWRGLPLRPSAPGWVYLRSLLIVLVWITYYAALPFLSLSLAAVALYSAPLMIALLSGLALGERVGPGRWLAIGLGFLGVIVILRPGAESFSWFVLLPLLGAFFYALAMVLTRRHCREEAPLGLALALNLSLLLAGLLGSGLLGSGLLGSGLFALAGLAPDQAAALPFLLGPWSAMGPEAWGLAAFLALLIAIYSACTAGAYQVAAPSLVAAFDYAYLIFAAFWGYLLFQEIPGAATLAGMALIAGGGLLALAPARPAHRDKPAAATAP